MLLYHNRGTLRSLFQVLGSAVYKRHIFIIAIILAAATAVLQQFQDADRDGGITMPHQYPIQTLGGIVTLALVFRTNIAWKRYWEAVSYLHLMYSKWADSFSQFSAFVSVTIMKTQQKGGDDVHSKVSLLYDLHEKVENDFLLLSAMACDRICRGDCARMERRADIGVPWTNRVVLREDLRKGEDLTNSKGMPKFIASAAKHERSNGSQNSQSSTDSKRRTVWDAEYLVKKEPSGAKYDLLANSFDRCNMVVNWLNHNLAYSSDVLTIAPPIQSRMFQEISNGMLGFNNALKLADVPLCFPYTQVLLMLLIIWTIFVPFFVMSFTRSLVAGPAFAFLLSSFMFALNDIARELENPFGQSANRICVPEFHARFFLVVEDASRSCYNPPRPPRIRSRHQRSTASSTTMKTSLVNLDTEFFDQNSSRCSSTTIAEAVSSATPRKRIDSDASLFAIDETHTEVSEDSLIIEQSKIDSKLLTPKSLSAVREVSAIGGVVGPPDTQTSIDPSISNAQAIATSLQEPKMQQQPASSPKESDVDWTIRTSSTGADTLFLRLAEVSERVEQHLSFISHHLSHITNSVIPSGAPSIPEAGQGLLRHGRDAEYHIEVSV